jgi:hypothetical protein
MGDMTTGPEELLMGWLLELLERKPDPWNDRQRSFLLSLLRTPEGTRTLGKLAATGTRLRKTQLNPLQMGNLQSIQAALEAFWNDPSPETYRDLGIARW